MERTTNDPQALILRLSRRLMETYMAELICDVLHYGESLYWFKARRQGLRDDLNQLLKEADASKENLNGR